MGSGRPSRSSKPRAADLAVVGSTPAPSATPRPASGLDGPPPVPGTDRVLRHPALAALRAQLRHDLLVEIIRRARDRSRSRASSYEDALEITAELAAAEAHALLPPPRRVINATGIVIHTGLGTAPLSRRALQRAAQASRATPTGAAGMGGRHEMAERMLRALTGAQGALVACQTAALCVLTGAALARGREVVCALRDLLEISHGIRLRDLWESGGCTVVPVGAANAVHLHDYTSAITPRTAAVLRIWHSNYATSGYTAHVDTRDLATVAHDRGLPLVLNLGAGSLVDLRERGLPWSPTLMDGLAWGADLVLASGDKLIGGPQAGIAVGRADLIQTLASHPLYRAVRPAKLDLAALEGTLASYLAGRAWEEIPVLRMLAERADRLQTRASAIADSLAAQRISATVVPATALCGGAVLPDVALPTFAIRLSVLGQDADTLHGRLLRLGVVARRSGGAVLLDLRSVLWDEDRHLLRRVRALTQDDPLSRP